MFPAVLDVGQIERAIQGDNTCNLQPIEAHGPPSSHEALLVGTLWLKEKWARPTRPTMAAGVGGSRRELKQEDTCCITL